MDVDGIYEQEGWFSKAFLVKDPTGLIKQLLQMQISRHIFSSNCSDYSLFAEQEFPAHFRSNSRKIDIYPNYGPTVKWSESQMYSQRIYYLYNIFS